MCLNLHLHEKERGLGLVLGSPVRRQVALEASQVSPSASRALDA